MQRDAWPLSGRTELIEGLLRDLDDAECDGLFLVGAPGVGTTRLLSEVHDHFAAEQRQVRWLVGSPATHASRFAAIAPIINGDLGAAVSLDPLQLYQRLRDEIGQVTRADRRWLVCVDDVRWLDEASLGLLTQLLGGRQIVLVASVRDDDALPDALDTIERSYSIRRTHVPPLSWDDTIDLVYSVLPGAMEGTTLHRLAEACQGNPLYLAEVIDGSIATGALERVLGTWTLHRAPTVTARLARLMDARLEPLDDAGRDLLDLIALAEPVALDALAAAGLLHAADRLEQTGLLATTRTTPAMVGIAQPLLSAQVRSRMSPLRRRALLPRAIELVAPAAGAETAQTDVVRLAMWRLECGQLVTAAELEHAALTARMDNDFELTAELTTAAAEISPTFNILLLQAEALFDLCHFERADAALRRLDDLVEDDIGRLRVAVVRHRGHLWGRHDVEASVQVLQDAIDLTTTPILRDLGRNAIANALVTSGRVDDAMRMLGTLEGDGPLETASAYFPRTVSAVLQGRTDEAVALGRAGFAARAALPDAAPVGHPLLSALCLGMALIDQGSFEEADEVLGAAYTAAVEQRNLQLQIWLGISRGRGYLFRGDLEEARLWFMEGQSISDRARFPQGLRLSLTGLVIASAQLGDVDAAQLADATLRTMPIDHALLHPERHHAHAWCLAASGRIDDALAELRLGAEEARERGEVLLQLEMLHEMARLGAAAEVADEMAEVVARCDGPLVRARASFVAGVAADDLVQLAAAEKQFANLGAWVSAAESARELARVLQAAGRPRDAQGATHRAGQYIADLAPARTPMLSSVGGPVALSPREREIATLAAAGQPSKVIAQQLGLSVRTVSNHLQNVYLKLGIGGRDDLAAALEG